MFWDEPWVHPTCLGSSAPCSLCSIGLAGMFSHLEEMLPCRGSSARCPQHLCPDGRCCKVLGHPCHSKNLPRAAVPWQWDNHDFILTVQKQGLKVWDLLFPHVQVSSGLSSAGRSCGEPRAAPGHGTHAGVCITLCNLVTLTHRNLVTILFLSEEKTPCN